MDPDQSDQRDIFMAPALYQWLYQSDRKKTVEFKANVRGFLKRYVIGDFIDNEDYMKSWRDDIFELRVQLQPRRERIRIFGAFAKPDVFVAIHQRPRSAFGGKNDPRWNVAIERVIDEFTALFPQHRPILSRPFSNCVTFNAYDVFERGAS
jgi:hypothetical protein